MTMNTTMEYDQLSGNDPKELLEEMNSEFTTKLLPVTIFVGIEVVVGFIGNFLTVFAFAFYYSPCNYRTFNICLGLIDFTCTLTTMPGEIITQRFWYNYPFPMVCKTKDFFNIFTVCAETLCLFVIAVDRYRKICRPLQWQVSPTAAVKLCFLVLFLAAAIASPVSVFWGIRSYEKVYKNTTITVTLCEKDEKYQHTDYPFGYEALVGGLIFVVLVPMLILNILVAVKLLSDKRRGMLDKSKSTRSFSSISTVSETKSDIDCAESNVDIEARQPSDVEVSINTKNGDDSQNKTEAPENDNQHTASLKYKPSRSKSTKDKTGTEPRSGSKRGNADKHQTGTRSSRVRRKALIMFILTATFICTTVLYFTMISILGSAGNVVNGLSDRGKALFFFFLRFYFIQHIINPILYAILDPQVQAGLAAMFRKVLCLKPT